MKTNVIKSIAKATYNKETILAVKGSMDIGPSVDIDSVNVVTGAFVNKLKKQRRFCKFELVGNYNDSCMYSFYKNHKGQYIPVRMSMHPKTEMNYYKGSMRYGSLAINREVW